METFFWFQFFAILQQKRLSCCLGGIGRGGPGAPSVALGPYNPGPEWNLAAGSGDGPLTDMDQVVLQKLYEVLRSNPRESFGAGVTSPDHHRQLHFRIF
jgi:hypothetical protein